MAEFGNVAGAAAGVAASSFAGPVAGALASSLVGGLFGKKKNKNKNKIRPFTPANLYTPSGNATWAGGNGTATLSPELQKYQDYYGENANNYQNQINSYFAPSRNNFYTTSPTKAPITPSTLVLGQSGNSLYDNILKNHIDAHQARYGIDWNTRKTKDSERAGELARIQNEYNEQAKNNPDYQDKPGVFDQAGFDAANANYVSPERTMYDKLRALSQPAEDQARADNESRLFSQGLLGASNGQGFNPGIKAFNDSANQANLQRELTSLTSTADLIAKWQNLQNTQSTGAQGLSQIPNELLKIGANVGVGAGNQAVNSALAQSQIANTQGDFWKSAAGSIGSAVSSGVNQLFSQPSDTNSPFSFKPSTTNNLRSGFEFKPNY